MPLGFTVISISLQLFIFELERIRIVLVAESD